MNENPLTESAAYWNKIILGNKSQSEHRNNSAFFAATAASETTAPTKRYSLQWRNILSGVLHGHCGFLHAREWFLEGSSMELCAYTVQLL